MTRRLLPLLLLLLLATPAAADPASTTREGRTLTVSKATGLAVDGEVVRVSGSGYDRAKGIYVAFCVDNGPGKVPTPCGGGADTEGRSGNSVWISDLPPAYGTGLAQPYGEGGSFDVEISVRAQLNEEVDCRTVRCAVVTRNDHTRSEDRSQDVLVPVSFGSATTPPARSSVPSRAPAAAPAPAAQQAKPQSAATLRPGESPVPTIAPTTAGAPAASAQPTETSSQALAAAPPVGRADDLPRNDDGSSLPILLLGGVALFAVGGSLTGRRIRRRRRG